LDDLLSCLEPTESIESLGERAMVLRGFARHEAAVLVATVAEITASAPFRNMITPGGFRMSVAMVE
jgi:alkylated DNA repair protein (DNA oxidative demethylase)